MSLAGLRVTTLSGLCGLVAACSTAAGTTPKGSSDAGPALRDAAFAPGSGDAATEPILAPPLEWTWVPFPDAHCRDGSVAGIEIDPNPASDEVMIFLQGGGSCWNAATCAVNPAGFDPTGFAFGTGVFDRTRAENPFRDWNLVYVPYCTGDSHAGKHPGFDPGGVGPQEFVGYENLATFLGRLVATFPNARKVAHLGSSAGGAGALWTVEMVRRRFPSSVDVVFLADSAPALSNAFLPACYEARRRQAFGFDATFLADCGEDCPDPDDYSLEYPLHLAKAYPALRGGIVETVADSVVLSYYGFAGNGCNVDQTVFPAPMDAATFEAGLLDFRVRMNAMFAAGAPRNFGTFYLPGTAHTWLEGDSLYTGSAGGRLLVEWLSGIVNGDPPADVGP